MLTPKLVARIKKTRGCWLWTGYIRPDGYGSMFTGSKTDGTARMRMAHQLVYEALVGPIPVGLELDHLCRRTDCVRPTHLEPVTHKENMRRGEMPSMLLHHAGVCKRGHPLDQFASRDPQTGKMWNCRICDRDRKRERYQRDPIYAEKRRRAANPDSKRVRGHRKATTRSGNAGRPRTYGPEL